MPSWPPVRHPHQLFLMAASLVSGAVGLAYGGAASSGTVRTLLPPALVLVWQLTLVVSGTLGLLAAVLAYRDGVLSLLMERIALGSVGVLACVYALATQMTVGLPAVHIAAMTGGYGMACLVRMAQVHQVLRWLNGIADRAQDDQPA